MNTFLPWYIAGPLIGLIVPLLLLLREKQFGVSSSYRYIGALVFPKWSYFNYKKEQDFWQLQFAIGVVLSGLAAYFYCDSCEFIPAQSSTSYAHISTTVYEIGNWWQFLIGGFLVGFGARYANGCTAGHCIMGIAQFSVASIIATISFFIGGLIASHCIVNFIFAP